MKEFLSLIHAADLQRLRQRKVSNEGNPTKLADTSLGGPQLELEAWV